MLHYYYERTKMSELSTSVNIFKGVLKISNFILQNSNNDMMNLVKIVK